MNYCIWQVISSTYLVLINCFSRLFKYCTNSARFKILEKIEVLIWKQFRLKLQDFSDNFFEGKKIEIKAILISPF